MEGIEFGGFFQQFVSWFAIQQEINWPAGLLNGLYLKG